MEDDAYVGGGCGNTHLKRYELLPLNHGAVH